MQVNALVRKSRTRGIGWGTVLDLSRGEGFFRRGGGQQGLQAPRHKRYGMLFKKRDNLPLP